MGSLVKQNHLYRDLSKSTFKQSKMVHGLHSEQKYSLTKEYNKKIMYNEPWQVLFFLIIVNLMKGGSLP